ncbi:MAG: CHAT domain-containing protein [Limnobacter sp.]|uniref:CHAT domain-containing protein n=1 Tax=Limnobacter sp. TaxID=2003368 RepID=UPI003919C81D
MLRLISERCWPTYGLALILAICPLGASARYEPFTTIASLAPEDESETRLWEESRTLHKRLIRREDSSYLKPATELLRAVVAKNLPGIEQTFKFHVYRSFESACVTTPAGEIFVSSGLLLRINDEQELMALLIREMGHVYYRSTASAWADAKVGASIKEVAITALSIYQAAMTISMLNTVNGIPSSDGITEVYSSTPGQPMTLIYSNKAPTFSEELKYLYGITATERTRISGARALEQALISLTKTSTFGYSEDLETAVDRFALSYLNERYGSGQAFKSLMLRLMTQAQLDGTQISDKFYSNPERLKRRLEVYERWQSDRSVHPLAVQLAKLNSSNKPANSALLFPVASKGSEAGVVQVEPFVGQVVSEQPSEADEKSNVEVSDALSLVRIGINEHLQSGEDFERIGDEAQALVFFGKALEMALASQLSVQTWVAKAKLMTLYAQGKKVRSTVKALEIGADLLNTYVASPEQFKNSSASQSQVPDQTVSNVYHQMYRLLLQAGQTAQAEQVLVMLKERELLNFLGLDSDLARSNLKSFDTTSKDTAAISQIFVRQDSGVAVLQYVLDEQFLSITLTSTKGVVVKEVRVSRRNIEMQISGLRTAISNRLDTSPFSRALWDVLIEPVSTELQLLKPHTLILGLTGRLRYLPFAALTDSTGSVLIERYALAYWGQAGGQATIDSPKPFESVAGLGVSQEIHGQSALPRVKDELSAIVRTENTPNGLVSGFVALDEEFDRDRFEKTVTQPGDAVHIASHFSFNPNSASRNLLYLGKGEPISLQALSKLDYSNINTMTLSACETANGGGVDEYGVEIEGLASTLLRAKSKTVIASLWKVDDNSTAALMETFYRSKTELSMSHAQALQRAQLEIRSGKGQQNDHPFYWAPFVVYGNWR